MAGRPTSDHGDMLGSHGLWRKQHGHVPTDGALLACYRPFHEMTYAKAVQRGPVPTDHLALTD